jgi:hypothetical protein
MTATIRIRNTDDAVATIASIATKVIAEGNHPGHDLEAVGARLATCDVLATIRRAYDRHTTNGATPKAAVIAVGQSLIAHYCNSAGIPTRG